MVGKGKVSEWSKEIDCKSIGKILRGFESHLFQKTVIHTYYKISFINVYLNFIRGGRELNSHF